MFFFFFSFGEGNVFLKLASSYFHIARNVRQDSHCNLIANGYFQVLLNSRVCVYLHKHKEYRCESYSSLPFSVQGNTVAPGSFILQEYNQCFGEAIMKYK